MSKLALLSLVFLVSLSAFAAPRLGGTVGNGGDIIQCRPEPGARFVGYYVLDYLLAATATAACDQDLTQGSPLNSIGAKLSSISSKLGKEFEFYRRDMDAQLFKSADFTRSQVWVPQRLGLSSLGDEFLFQKLPSNCYQPGAPDQLQVIQAVIREERPDSTIYRYDELQVKELQRQSPFQFSMLAVHEWLWNYAGTANIVRDANNYLHSQEFQNDTAITALTKLKNMGVDVGREGPKPTPPTHTLRVTTTDPSTIKPIHLKASPETGLILEFYNDTDKNISIYAARGMFQNSVVPGRRGVIHFWFWEGKPLEVTLEVAFPNEDHSNATFKKSVILYINPE